MAAGAQFDAALGNKMPFETVFSCTLKELQKANRARMFVLFKSNWLIFLSVFIGIPAITYGQGIMEGDKATIISGLTVPFVLVLVFYIAIMISTKMVFEKNRTSDKLDIHYRFYDDGFQMESPLIKNSVSYDALNRIYEDKDYFFLKLSSSKILVVQKTNCSPELISFLKEKAALINSGGKRK